MTGIFPCFWPLSPRSREVTLATIGPVRSGSDTNGTSVITPLLETQPIARRELHFARAPRGAALPHAHAERPLVILLVLLIGLLNFGLGFGLALWLERRRGETSSG